MSGQLGALQLAFYETFAVGLIDGSLIICYAAFVV